MELIRPAEVTGKILSLIEDAEKTLIIISPYNNFIGFNKFIKRFKEAKEKGIEILYYSRKNEIHKGMDLIDIEPLLIENLHAKLYLNEKYAIFSSMNLVKYSDDFSIDFAFKTETKAEYDAAVNFYESFIKSKIFSYSDKLIHTNDFLNEVPFQKFFEADVYKDEQVKCHKTYYNGSCFIKEVGYLKGESKIGLWFYFNPTGLLEKTESYFNEEVTSTIINYKGKVSRYDLVVSIGNVIGGLFNTSINDLYFKSKIKRYTKGQNEKLFKYLQSHLNIPYIDTSKESMEGLIEDIHEQLYLKKSI
jgi:hypothetical protein